MSILDDIRKKVLGIFNKELKSEFVQQVKIQWQVKHQAK